MKRHLRYPLATAVLLGAGTLAATADQNPSVLVQLAPLQQGALPRVVTVYGNVGSYSSGKQTVMAPLQAAVTDVFVRTGELVAKGAPLVRLIPSPTLLSAYAQAETALKLADELETRTQSMVTGHLATDEELFQAEKDAADARVALAALKAQGADGPHTLTAPFAAIVTTINTTPGAIVSEADSLVQLARPGDLEVEAGVIPNEAETIDVGDPVALTPIGGGVQLAGKVAFRGALVESVDGLVPVDIAVPAGQTLFGEMFRADITVGQVYGYIVPHAAVLVNDSGQTYIVQAHNMTAKEVLVRVRDADNGEDVISGPVDARSPVVLAGNYQLDDGVSIRVVDPKTKAASP